jgi:hypothetical protein
MDRILASCEKRVELVESSPGRFTVRESIDGKHSATYSHSSSERDARILYEMLKHSDCPKCGETKWAEAELAKESLAIA